MSVVRASAPGRVNLIGEHTDYNLGLVLPVALPQRVTIELHARDDRRAVVRSDIEPRAAAAEFELDAAERAGDWADYARGVTRVLVDRGYPVGGFEAGASADLPHGAGLGSSAAFSVALLRAVRTAFALALDDLEIARLAHAAETEFVGARVGLMDQLAASLGEPGAALLIDTRDLRRERVPLPREVELVVIDSGIRHAHASGAYNRRRQECEEACRHLGVSSLREVGPESLDGAQRRLPETLGRRVRHVVTENDRVRAAVEALRARDAARLGALLGESHRSLRHDYEVSTPEVDALVDELERQREVYGARLTGGGFGGSVLALARAGSGEAIGYRALEAYAARTGRTGRLVLPWA